MSGVRTSTYELGESTNSLHFFHFLIFYFFFLSMALPIFLNSGRKKWSDQCFALLYILNSNLRLQFCSHKCSLSLLPFSILFLKSICLKRIKKKMTYTNPLQFIFKGYCLRWKTDWNSLQTVVKGTFYMLKSVVFLKHYLKTDCCYSLQCIIIANTVSASHTSFTFSLLGHDTPNSNF